MGPYRVARALDGLFCRVHDLAVDYDSELGANFDTYGARK